MTNKEIRAKLRDEGCCDSISQRDGKWTVRRTFFYRHGGTAEKLWLSVNKLLPDASLVDMGEVWKPFNGGASVARSSHWYVVFTMPTSEQGT